MNKLLTLFLLVIVITMSACTPQATATPTPLPATEPVGAVATQTPVMVVGTETVSSTDAASPTEVVLPTVEEQPAEWKQYTNSTFGLSFQFPAAWYGPEEYASDQALRVEVGSDVVYPYGTSREEQIYTLPNSYSVVIQYTLNYQDPYWKELFQSLENLQDGEALSDLRSMTIRVREIHLGRFKGVEFISTLSETAQTEPFYTRQVILYDDQSNQVTIMGAPNNVVVSNEVGWREAYRMVDEANLDLFHRIVESVRVE